MIQATCRCGQLLKVPDEGNERVVCPSCGKRVRVRRTSRPASEGGQGESEGQGDGDGYLRFFCTCGRRLKVPAKSPPTHGKCPDCARIVPVPTASTIRLKDRTEDLGPQEIEQLRHWAAEHIRKGSRVPAGVIAEARSASALADGKEEGFRLCPNCGKPLHLRADNCQVCGTPVPRKTDG